MVRALLPGLLLLLVGCRGGAPSTPAGDSSSGSSSDDDGGSSESGTSEGAADETTGAPGTTGSSSGASTTGGGDGDPSKACGSQEIVAPPASVVTALSLDPFYEQYLDADGLAVLSSSQVDPQALRVACEIAVEMLKTRPDVRDELISNGIRIGVMAVTEVTTDMPEHSDLDEAFPETDWDERARGLGATLVRPLSSVGEENLLHLPGDVYDGESIMVHEFAHTVFEVGAVLLPDVGPGYLAENEALYQAALRAGTWTDTYAATDRREYFAEAVQSFYDTNLQSDPRDGVHGPIDTEAELLAADPAMHAFLEQFFVRDDWVVP